MLPLYRFTIESPLAPQGALERIRVLIKENQLFGRNETFSLIKGVIKENTFKFYYTTSSVAMIRWQVVAPAKGAKINIIMYYSLIRVIAILIWASIFISLGNTGKHRFGDVFSLFSIVFVVIYILFHLYTFLAEARKIRHLLEQALCSTDPPTSPMR